MAISLGTVLSKIKLFHFPYGGSITLLSMLVICLPGHFYGLGAGLLAGVAYGVLQLLIDPYVLFPMQAIVDYVLAFGALGLSGLFSNAKNGLIKGYVAGILGRYVFVVISGWIFLQPMRGRAGHRFHIPWHIMEAIFYRSGCHYHHS